MNMLLHDVNYTRFKIDNDDTLENPAFRGEKFDAVVANPPYSAKWSADPSFLDDERFSGYGKLAPKSKADFAFIQHMIHYLDDNGTMAVVLPHGVLFRGAAEGTIRKYLIEEKLFRCGDWITSKPILWDKYSNQYISIQKCREDSDNVLFIDASQSFEKVKSKSSHG